MKVWESVPAVPRTTRVGLLEEESQTSDLLSPAEAEQMPVHVWPFHRAAATDEEKDGYSGLEVAVVAAAVVFPPRPGQLGVQPFDASN